MPVMLDIYRAVFGIGSIDLRSLLDKTWQLSARVYRGAQCGADFGSLRILRCKLGLYQSAKFRMWLGESRTDRSASTFSNAPTLFFPMATERVRLFCRAIFKNIVFTFYLSAVFNPCSYAQMRLATTYLFASFLNCFRFSFLNKLSIFLSQ